MARDDTAVTMAVLFEPKPETWGLRGDPYLWADLRDYLSDVALPPSVDMAVAYLRDAFFALMGLDFVAASESQVYREQYAHGGMSSGYVAIETWRDRLMPLLAERARRLLAT